MLLNVYSLEHTVIWLLSNMNRMWDARWDSFTLQSKYQDIIASFLT